MSNQIDNAIYGENSLFASGSESQFGYVFVSVQRPWRRDSVVVDAMDRSVP